MTGHAFAKARVEETAECLTALNTAHVIEIVDMLAASINSNGRIFVAGNGGSMAQAQHFAADLVGLFDGYRIPLPARALGVDNVLNSALSNDIGFENALAHELAPQITQRDILLVLTTSGESENIYRAVQAARSAGATSIALTGKSRTPLEEMCSACLQIDSLSVAVIQEVHLVVLHLIAQLLRPRVDAP